MTWLEMGSESQLGAVLMVLLAGAPHGYFCQRASCPLSLFWVNLG